MLETSPFLLYKEVNAHKGKRVYTVLFLPSLALPKKGRVTFKRHTNVSPAVLRGLGVRESICEQLDKEVLTPVSKKVKTNVSFTGIGP